ncbi:MAG: HTH domain-containing protein [Sulfobacillus thermotolerans]|nr:HTH domain-containing protein [Sulfobacillus thermotolerans]
MPSGLREKIVLYLTDHPVVTTEELRQEMGVSRRHVQRTLHQLVSEGVVRMSLLPGSRHTGEYRLVPKESTAMQPVNRLLSAIQEAGGPALRDRILEIFIDDYYRGRMDHTPDDVSRDESLMMSWNKTPNGWWITMQRCPFPYWRGTQSVCDAEARAFAHHLDAPAIHLADGERGVCQFFVPLRTDMATTEKGERHDD